MKEYEEPKLMVIDMGEGVFTLGVTSETDITQPGEHQPGDLF